MPKVFSPACTPPVTTPFCARPWKSSRTIRRVAYAALFFGNLSPEEARQWADNFKQSAPGNTMADYASALNYMKSGQTDLAMQDMATAAKASRGSITPGNSCKVPRRPIAPPAIPDIDAKIASQAPFQLPDLAPA